MRTAVTAVYDGTDGSCPDSDAKVAADGGICVGVPNELAEHF
jgi:hypothetical protein